MGVFGAVFGCRGDGGFSGALLWVSSGVVGFNVATLSRLVREKVRPARPDVGASAKRFAPQAQNGQNMLCSGALGEYFHGNAAGGIPPGEFFRGPAVVGSQRASVLCRVPGSRAHLLATLTRSCVAKPTWWKLGTAAHAPLGGLTCASVDPGHHLSG